ncbi:MAG: putative lipid II flippase FtsW [Clostridia bacterium]|nr:putative lipid II flippase FtsW [Clostridia bacterium]
MTKVKRARKWAINDFILVFLTMSLVIFGVVMVFSASYYNAISEKGNPYYFLIRDAIWAGAGTVLMFVMTRINYRILCSKKVAVFMLAVGFLGLLAVFTPLGVTLNSATRWISVGGITVMPGEIAKIVVIIFMSWYLGSKPDRIFSFGEGIVVPLVLCAVFGGLIMKQPNMSTAITVCAIVIGIMFFAGLRWRYILGVLSLGAFAALVLIFMDEDGYRFRRFTSFLNPFDDPLNTGYQVVQSLLALGSGGFFGLGLGKGIQKTLYLPEPQNDFILAIIGEELGYFGILILMAVYLILIWRGMHIALNAPDHQGMLMAAGITTMIAVQVVLNIAVVTSSMPPTGVTLPFISYGGNALLLFMGSMGILLNISRQSRKKEPGSEQK